MALCASLASIISSWQAVVPGLWNTIGNTSSSALATVSRITIVLAAVLCLIKEINIYYVYSYLNNIN